MYFMTLLLDLFIQPQAVQLKNWNMDNIQGVLLCTSANFQTFSALRFLLGTSGKNKKVRAYLIACTFCPYYLMNLFSN